MLTTSLPNFRREIQFALFPFRSLLIRESLNLFSLPAGTKMFQFPAFSVFSDRFRNPRIKAHLQLPGAYRSLPRLSSKPKPSHPSNSVSNSICPSKSIRKTICAYLIEHDPRRDVLELIPEFLRGTMLHSKLGECDL